MRDLLIIILSSLVALFSVSQVHSKILRIAKARKLTDNPGERKLQRHPVPMLGGIAVFMGVICGLGMACTMADLTLIFPIVMMMATMLYIGALDDLTGLSPVFRIVMEIFAVLVLIYGSGMCIDNFNGLWGIYQIPWTIAVPLTVFAGVGIINSINMIDGINGLSSGLCIACSLYFGANYFHLGDIPNSVVAFTMAFSLMPFLVHNVFGLKSRMFIGDAGTMMMGILLTWFVIRYLSFYGIERGLPGGLCPIANSLSILSVPVFDTLRVMVMRMIRGRSPFSPDRTHLHHAFVDCGFSHVFTAVSEILISMVVFLTSNIAYWLDFSSEIQLYLVIIAGAIFVWGTYFVLIRIKGKRGFKFFALRTHFEHKGWWLVYQNWLDGKKA
ncbi:MAG: undecaprenyl/decaprenyl-phosphate alpha-N-acetylglucosaminyl 1-phosphate transferase [Prevotella sp.]|nr:undecaprenyl/decaprenyl-phosphate alpha-N-acetylglucosaminyl 1-phosphate transferase [Prevotella sp.]